MSDAILVEGVTKRFRSIVALDDVSLRVGHGDAIAVVGPNGAGKSTLLRLMAGVGRPDAGRIVADRKVNAFLDLGVGFHPDCTGREGAILAALVAGATRRQAERRLPEIIEFSGLGRVIDQPLRTYSSGMRARLAFAVAARDDVGVLIVDEALAVGDLSFRQRCLERIRDLRSLGCGLVLATHELDLAAEMCDRAVWLSAGRVVAEGRPGSIGERYRDEVRRQMVASTPIHEARPAGRLVLGQNRWGSQEVTIGDVTLSDVDGVVTETIATGDGLRVTFVVRSPVARTVNVAVSVLDADELVCIDTGTAVEVGPDDVPVELVVERVELNPGAYALDVGVYDERWDARFDYHHAAYPLVIAGPRGRNGVVIPPIRWGLPVRSTARPDVQGERSWRRRSSTSS